MNKAELFDIWSPREGRWSPWAKPVLFSQWEPALTDTEESAATFEAGSIPVATGDMAIVVDLPGAKGVAAGLSLAEHGYRPVPLYNALPTPRNQPASARVEVWSIVAALGLGAERLKHVQFAPGAPPAFLLDSDRRWGGLRPSSGAFDNRSVSFPTDFPSGNFLLNNGIQRVLLVQRRLGPPQEDLAHTLRLWQQAGVVLEHLGVDPPTIACPLIVPKPSVLGWILFRARTLLHLQRHPLGGFGGMLPEAASG
jgi:hypothetical protein